MTCREGCGACCTAPSISSPIPGMPRGKPAGVRCVQLDERNRCRIFGRPERPAVCVTLRPHASMCGHSRAQALAGLLWLEVKTSARVEQSSMRLIQELKVLHGAVLGTELTEVRDPQVVLQRLREGEADLPLALEWGERREGELHEHHAVVLQRIEGDRVWFFNPLAHDESLPPGSPLGGPEQGPVRRVEELGVESVTIPDFERFFAERGAVCLIPG